MTGERPTTAASAGRCRRLPWQGARRVGDGSPSRGYKNARGLTILELIVAMAVLAVTLAVAMPAMPRHAFALWNADRQLLADLRQARADALTKGDHFRVDVTGATSYVEYRLRLVGADWTASGAPVRSRTLPEGVVFTAGVGSSFEFNTRGLLVTPGAATSLALAEEHSGLVRQITIWPSGQVAPL